MKNFKTFTEYLNEASKHAVFTFGRFNPPTIGHEKLINRVAQVAGSDDYFVYASQSTDPKRNPLDYDTKIKYMRKLFPKHARNIIHDRKVKMVFDILTRLYERNYTSVTMVVGSDRLTEFETLSNKYNGVKGRHGFYNFESINIVSAGDRDPDADSVAGMSASKMRAAAMSNDFDSFQRGIPSGFKETAKLFNDLRKAMGLSEGYTRPHLKLRKVSDIRESYVKGNLYEKGDWVSIDGSDDVAKVIVCGSNYLILEHNGSMIRKWIEDVEKLDE